MSPATRHPGSTLGDRRSGAALAIAGEGGVGKTTTTINLGASLAARSKSVVAVELDLAMANLVDFLTLDCDKPGVTMHDVLAGEAAALDAVYRRGDKFAVAPSGTDLEGFADTDLDRLEDVVDAYRACFDVVLLDTGAGVSRETIEPLKLADSTVIVSTPRVAAVRDADKTTRLVDQVNGDLAGLVLTKSGTGASPGADRIAEFLDVELLGHVPADDAVPASQDHGEPVVDRYPNSGAAHAYRLVAVKLLGEAIPTKPGDIRDFTGNGSVTRPNTATGSTVNDGGKNELPSADHSRRDEGGETIATDGTDDAGDEADATGDETTSAAEDGWMFGGHTAGDR